MEISSRSSIRLRLAGPKLALLAFLLLLSSGLPAGAATRALIIGIDDYPHIQKLRGAVADARDLEQTLRRIGVSDIRLIINNEARRATVLDALDALSASARADDVVYVAFAGNGAQEPEHIRGTKPDGMDQVFLLQAFDPENRESASEKILDSELNRFARKIEAAGARVVIVADACWGDALPREVDPRGNPDLVYRIVHYPPVKDGLADTTQVGDGRQSSRDLNRSLLLAATDKNSRVPELHVPATGWRGGLSYAVARGLEGAADQNSDGKVTAEELFGYTRQIAHQLSGGRQTIALLAPAQAQLQSIVVGTVGRGIAVKPAGSPAPSAAGLTILPVDDQFFGQELDKPTKESSAPPSPPRLASDGAAQQGPPANSRVAGSASASTIKLASLDGESRWFADLAQSQQVAIVPPNAQPDLVWDPRSRDVLSGPDVIARNIDPADLAGVVEHIRVLDWLKQRSTRAAQPIALLPGDQVHTKGTRVEVEVGDLANRFLVLFNVSGNGAVQLLYPLGSDPPQRADALYSVQFQVRDPFGADHIVAITSAQRMPELERVLRQSARRLNADRLADALNRPEALGAKVGYVGLYTSP